MKKTSNNSLANYTVIGELNSRKYRLDGEDAIAKVEYPELQPDARSN